MLQLLNVKKHQKKWECKLWKWSHLRGVKLSLILMFLYIYVLHLETNQNKLELFSNKDCVINAGVNCLTG